eukprot:TRINITY_DN3339_c0_g1_i1.p1 TRINITY_DN3339_c0_g1~~TRINITY_DN3339_c0_g1_i1.p1  ORF type:complete len:119 (+),score=7.07 TRINITY_DN3339_c0_g1_i1:92-448(+)
MPFKRLRSQADITSSLKEPCLGKIVCYFFEEVTPVHSVLAPLYEEITRRDPESRFFSVESEDVTEEISAQWGVWSFPTILVLKGGDVVSKIQVSTRDGLIKQMKKAGILKEDEEITNV